MVKVSLSKAVYLCLFSASISAHAVVYPTNYPNTGSGSTMFDWQKRWGSIHINSFADGLNDPGTKVTPDGQVPCDNRPSNNSSLCESTLLYTDVPKPISEVIMNSRPQDIMNGIKYDIKNSVVNCMSWNIPTSPILNGGRNGYDLSTCKDYMDPPVVPIWRQLKLDNKTLPVTLVHSPIWDPRTNDSLDRNAPNNDPVGCQQQIVNNCILDVNDCHPDSGNGKQNKGTTLTDEYVGYRFPVTHVFSPDEVNDLGGKGSTLPDSYYQYLKIVEKKHFEDMLEPPKRTDYYLNLKDYKKEIDKKETTVYSYDLVTKYRSALSLDNSPSDQVPNTDINGPYESYDSNLARLKSYEVNMSTAGSEGGKFIIVDPTDFFDLNLYRPGGKYDSGYKQVHAATGLVMTPDTCPIIGITGYSGICDPTGQAGCNLPIYRVGPTTSITNSQGESYKSTAFPIIWSGYVKRWAFISPEEYLQNIKNRKGVNGGGLFITSLPNNNPVLQITRADDYCTPNERYSGQVPKDPKDPNHKPDLPCVQYLQYQSVAYDGYSEPYEFVDLYQPDEDSREPSKASYKLLHLFSADEKGNRKEVVGTGSNKFVGSGKIPTGYASFLDTDLTYVDFTKKDDPNSGVTRKVVEDKSLSVHSTYASDDMVVGEYIVPTDPNKGVKVSVPPGTAAAIQFPGLLGNEVKGINPFCAIIKNNSKEDLFIPTNSQEEFQSFISQFNLDNDKELSAQSCVGNYQTYLQKVNLPPTSSVKNPNGSVSWIGQLRCSELAEKPACNQTKVITAMRSCLLENGNLGACDACTGAIDPDKALIASLYQDPMKTVQGEIISNQVSKCFFQAVCFAINSPGCPTVPSGGHVFCLAPDTKITMADGSQKEIKDIHPDEEVLAFDAKHSKTKKIKKAKVVATTVTEDQAVIKINELEITPKHKIVLSTGRAIKANDVKIGDKILKENGEVEEVISIDKNRPKINVYNLILENTSVGYMANGVRVLSYPMVKGINKK